MSLIKSFLEQRLQRQVLLVTAPTLREFDERALTRAYEIAMIAPQTARLAQREVGYVPLLRVSEDLCGVFLVPEASPLRSIKDLAGKPIAFPDRFTATARLGLESLSAAGVPDSTVVYPTGYQDSLLMLLQRGEFPVVLMNKSAFFQAPADLKKHVRELAETRQIPHVMFVARPDIPPEQQAAIRAAIEAFMQNAEVGRKFIAQTGLTGVRPPTEAELRSLDTLAAHHKRLLEEAREAESAPR